MSDLVIVFSRAQNGIDTPLVRVEVHLSRGLPGLSIPGISRAPNQEQQPAN